MKQKIQKSLTKMRDKRIANKNHTSDSALLFHFYYQTLLVRHIQNKHCRTL